jgi:acetoin utilization deacetylase AcuC-like enzyme
MAVTPHAERPIPVVTDDRHRAHDPAFELNGGQEVRPRHERPARMDVIQEAVVAAGHPVLTASTFDDRALLAVHEPAMVDFLRDGYGAWRAAGGAEVMLPDTFRSPRWARGGRISASPIAQPGWWCFDTATPLVAGSYAAGRAAVDIALTAAELVAAGSPAVYGLTRPPGHHAGADYFGGFCLFNHAAVAARSLTAGGRVAVLDIDVHHGNGTQDVFWEDDQVLYVSLHGDPDHLFPFFSGFSDERGAAAGRGTTRNLPLGPGTDDTAYLTALAVACELIHGFDPASVVVSLGLDALAHDPLGSLALTRDGYAGAATMIAALDRPTLLLQEGGYAVDHLGELATTVLAPFATAR